MVSIQFYRVSQALSNGIWLKFKSEKVSGKKITNIIPIFIKNRSKIGQKWCQ